MPTPAPLFQGEAMLLSWGDTSSRGKTVTFALHPDECGDAHPFRGLGTGKTGQRFAIVAVPITDDEEISPEALDQAAESPAPGPGSPAHAKPGLASGESKKTYTLANRVGMTCAEPAFQKWLSERYNGTEVNKDTVGPLVRLICGVETRADILPGTTAATKWHALALDYEQATGRIAEERR